MKNIWLSFFIKILITVITSLIVSFSIQYFNYHSIVVIDLGKIIKAQSMLASKITTSGEKLEPWKISFRNIGNDLKKTISEVAGKNTIVIISPAVIQGAENITDKVLQKLGLSINIPNFIPPVTSIFPEIRLNDQQGADMPSWMVP